MYQGAENLRKARQRLGLSQRELAAWAGVPQVTISRIEGGLRPSAVVACALAKTVEVPVAKLFPRTPERVPA